MSYVPNADDATQPTTEKFVISAAEEFRKIKIKLNALALTVPGGAATILGGTTIANFTVDQTTPNQRVVFADTIPAGWNTAAGSCYLQFEFKSTGYFVANPIGHFAVVARCDTAVIATAVRGQGAAFGDLRGAQEGTQTNPGAQLETWANGLAPTTNRYLIPNAASPANKPLQDGVLYRAQIESVRSSTSTRLMRLAVYRENAARAAFDLEFDTGYVTDDNVYSDITKSGLAFGFVFGSNLAVWNVLFSNIKIVWGPPPFHVGTSIDRINRYGDTMEGNLSFVGGYRRIKVDMSGGYNLWTAFQATTALATSVVAIPGPGQTVSNFLATNKDVLNVFGYIAIGMTDANGVIETLGIGGHSAPPVNIRPNGITAFSCTPGFAWLPASTRALNALSTALTGPTNVGGAQGLVMAQNVLDYEYMCTPGNVTTYLTTNAVENLFRPIFGVISHLISELRQKKMI